MVKEIQTNLFDSPAQMRCYQVTHTTKMDKGIAAEAKARYPGMVEEFTMRCKLWGSKNIGDVHFYLAPDGKVCANMFAETDEKLKACIRSVYEFAVRYKLSVAFPTGKALGSGNWKTTKAVIDSMFKASYAPVCYLVDHAEAADNPTSEPNTHAESPASKKARPKVQIYTDGSCLGNPGPGGWAAILVNGTKEKILVNGHPKTTNNQMELSAPIAALSSLKVPCEVTLYSDSKYLIDSFEKGWLDSWQKNGWKKADKKPVLNAELWQQLVELTKKHNVTFVWVKGHADNPYNNRCDQLAVAEAKKHQ